MNGEQGKKNKASGARFELKVRKDLEDKGWIVSKWMNNIELWESEWRKNYNDTPEMKGKLIPAKHKFRGLGIPMAIGTGFPDFIVFRPMEIEAYQSNEKIMKILEEFNNLITEESKNKMFYEVNGVEVKSNGYLKPEEKEKCKWLLDNNVFSKILIAKKGTKRGEIIYREFK